MTNSSAARPLKMSSVGSRFRNLSPNKMESNENFKASVDSNISQLKIEDEFLEKIDKDTYREELQKRIFRVLLKEYDDNMEFTNPEHDRAQNDSQLLQRKATKAFTNEDNL